MASHNKILTFLLLTTILFFATATEEKTTKPADCSKINSLNEICKLTLFPSSCYNTLKINNLAPNGTIESESIYVKSIQVAMAEVSRTAHDFSAKAALQRLVIGKTTNRLPSVLSAMETCRELLSLAIDNINRSSSLAGRPASEKSYDSVRSWLSAAGTDLQTCEDGFEDLSDEARDIVAAKLRNSTEYTSNSLAIATQFGRCEELKVKTSAQG